MKIVAAAFAEDQKKTTAAAVVQVVDSENQESFTNAEAAAIVIQVHLAVVQGILLQAVVEHIVQVLVKSEEELELVLVQAAEQELQLAAF